MDTKILIDPNKLRELTKEAVDNKRLIDSIKRENVLLGEKIASCRKELDSLLAENMLLKAELRMMK